jgi:hypothetical protein
MADTNWVDRPGTKHPTCSCGLANALANVVVVDVLFLLLSSSPFMLPLSTLSMTESLMPLCRLAHAFLASSLIIFSPLPTAQLMNVPALLLLLFLRFL